MRVDRPTIQDFSASTPRQPIDRRRLLIGAGAAAVATLIGPEMTDAKSRVDRIVDDVIARMSLAEKVAQLFVVDAVGTRMTPGYEEHLKRLKPGGVILFSRNVGPASQLTTFTEAIHRSVPTIPPFIAVDQEGGPVARISGDPAPGAVELGNSPDDVVIEKARERADFLRAFGFDVNFAPVADVAYQANSMMTGRAFGTNPRRVANKVGDFVRGSRKGGMAGAAKHFPGHGRTSADSHFVLPEIDLTVRDWYGADGLPFRSAIRARVEMVMIGHLRYPRWDRLPTSLSPVAVTILRQDLGFKGVIVTDDLAMGALQQFRPKEALDLATDAGIDLFLYASAPIPIDDLMGHLRRRVERGEVDEARIDASLRRILTFKVQRFDLKEHDGS